MLMGLLQLVKAHFFIEDYSNNTEWQKSEDVWGYVKNHMSPYQNKPLPNNTITIRFLEINGTKWILREAYYISFVPEELEALDGMYWCRAYTIYDERYELDFYVDIRDKTLDDPETKELVTKIMESFQVVSIESR